MFFGSSPNWDKLLTFDTLSGDKVCASRVQRTCSFAEAQPDFANLFAKLHSNPRTLMIKNSGITTLFTENSD